MTKSTAEQIATATALFNKLQLHPMHYGPAKAAAIRDEFAQALADEAARVRMEALAWSEDDMPLPEDAEILAHHPTENDSFATYAEAMRLVGAKRSKGALVDLVNWLLQRANIAAAIRALSPAEAGDECADGVHRSCGVTPDGRLRCARCGKIFDLDELP